MGSVWSMKDRDRLRDHGCLCTAVQEHSQDWTQMPKACWDKHRRDPALLHGGKSRAHLMSSSRPMGWLLRILGAPCLLQPHVAYLFLYLHCTTCVREENSLGFFLEVSLLRIDGICSSLTFASHLPGWLQDSACSWSIWRNQSRSGASWPEGRQKCVNMWVPAGWERGESLVIKRRSGFVFGKHIPTSSVMHTKYNVPEKRCYHSIEDCSIHHHWNHDYALQKSNCHLHPNE